MHRALEFFEKRQFNEALAVFRLLPDSPGMRLNIGICLKEVGQTDEAFDVFKSLLHTRKNARDFSRVVRQNYLHCLTLRVKLLTDVGDITAAEEINLEAEKLLRRDPIITYNLGHIKKCKGEYDAALPLLRRTVEQDPQYFDAYIEQINIHNDRKDYAKSEKVIREAMYEMPKDARLYNELGVCLVKQGRMRDGFDAYRTGAEMPGCSSDNASKIYTNAGNAYTQIGDIPNALASTKKAVELDAKNTTAIQNVLMNTLYLCDRPFRETLAEHFRYGALFAAAHASGARPVPASKHRGRVRLGYVSGDLCGTHPVTLFVRALLTSFDAGKFEIFCYSAAPLPDKLPFSPIVKWRCVKYMSTANARRMVLDDQIDVLIDLSGHTAANRLDIFAVRVARLQFSYIGYPCVTGLPEIDYMIIDRTFGLDNRMKTISMPHCFTHFWPNWVPLHSQLQQPYRTHGALSFGTLNKLAKVNTKMVEMWDCVLDAFPNARLVIRRNYVFKFRNQDRVVFLEHMTSYEEHMMRYNEIDIALDTAPYSGTTTTCESLTMGVPVVTLRDLKEHTIHQNVSASILINSALPQFAVASLEEFIAVCRRAEEDIRSAEGNAYKVAVQQKFLSGHVTDSEGYVRDFENLIQNTLRAVDND